MLLSPNEDLIVSSLAWTDKAGLWILETKTGDTRQVQLSDAKYLSLYPGANGLFSVLHCHDGTKVELTAHSFSNPEKIISRITFGPKGGQMESDTASWQSLPGAYIAYFTRPAGSDFHLFLIDGVRQQTEIRNLDWYDNSYDKDYQGVVSVMEVPGKDELLFSVQRDSNLVRVSRGTGKIISKVPLANRSGNPVLKFRSGNSELWANDYDTLLRLNPETWQIQNSLHLQGAALGSAQFIGDFAFSPDESLCAVARPFSGDVVGLDTRRFKVTHTCPLNGQPLAVRVLSNGAVYARDWKSGKLLQGVLKKKWFS